MGYDLRDDNGQLSELPNSLAALEAEIQSAVASGVIVVFSAGNGHFSFPLPSSVGGMVLWDRGLWPQETVWFSRHGTLVATVEAFVNQSSNGYYAQLVLMVPASPIRTVIYR